MRFSNDLKMQKKSQKIFYSISHKLSNLESELAGDYLLWLDKQTTYFKESVDKSSYGVQPDNIMRGDIVWVEFGINIGTELSDYKTKGHYAIVWAVDLGNIVVIPLSSRDSPGSILTFDVGVIKELNEVGGEQHSYIKLDAIRSISKRRVARISGKENGKVRLSNEVIEHIKSAISRSFLEG